MGSTDWLIISLSITRINALLTGVSLSIATANLQSRLLFQIGYSVVNNLRVFGNFVASLRF